MPVDWVALAAVVLGCMIFIIPIAGFTVRYALKPFVETLGEHFAARQKDEDIARLERRLVLIEQEIDHLASSVQRALDEADFHKELTSGSGARPGSGADAG